MELTWLLTTPYVDVYEEKKKYVLRKFEDRTEAFEEFYVAYMKEVLSRNRYMNFDSLLQLECYGPSIADAVAHNPIEIHTANEITEDMVASFNFSKDEGKQFQQQMLKFYNESRAYEVKRSKMKGWV